MVWYGKEKRKFYRKLRGIQEFGKLKRGKGVSETSEKDNMNELTVDVTICIMGLEGRPRNI